LIDRLVQILKNAIKIYLSRHDMYSTASFFFLSIEQNSKRLSRFIHDYLLQKTTLLVKRRFIHNVDFVSINRII